MTRPYYVLVSASCHQQMNLQTNKHTAIVGQQLPSVTIINFQFLTHLVWKFVWFLKNIHVCLFSQLSKSSQFNVSYELFNHCVKICIKKTRFPTFIDGEIIL